MTVISRSPSSVESLARRAALANEPIDPRELLLALEVDQAQGAMPAREKTFQFPRLRALLESAQKAGRTVGGEQLDAAYGEDLADGASSAVRARDDLAALRTQFRAVMEPSALARVRRALYFRELLIRDDSSFTGHVPTDREVGRLSPDVVPGSFSPTPLHAQEERTRQRDVVEAALASSPLRGIERGSVEAVLKEPGGHKLAALVVGRPPGMQHAYYPPQAALVGVDERSGEVLWTVGTPDELKHFPRRGETHIQGVGSARAGYGLIASADGEPWLFVRNLDDGTRTWSISWDGTLRGSVPELPMWRAKVLPTGDGYTVDGGHNGHQDLSRNFYWVASDLSRVEPL